MKPIPPIPSHVPLLLSLLGATALAAGCGGGGGSGSSPQAGAQAAALQVWLGRGPDSELLSLSTQVQSLRLVREDGSPTANLLLAPQDVEWNSLGDARRLLAAVDAPPATYTGVELGFAPSGHSAADLNGNPVTVLGGGTWAVDLAAPGALGASGTQTLALDLDVAAAVVGDPGLGAVTLTPAGEASFLGDDKGLIDEVRGVVLSKDQPNQTFVVQAFADDAGLVPVGPVEVSLAPGAALVLPNKSLAPSAAAFVALLSPNQSFVEVHGLLQPNGTILAHRVELEDGPPFGPGGKGQVRIRGSIVELLSQDEFRMQVQLVKDGASVAGPVLEGLGNPSTIRVRHDQSTRFVLGDDNLPASAADLAVGKEVKVRFSAFASEPFPASEVEFEGGAPEFEGRITDISELPARFEMRLFPGEPALLGGQVASSSTDVVVELADNQRIYLQLSGDPALEPLDLLLDLKVRVRGSLSGSPQAPTIQAVDVRVRPGRLDKALVTQVFPLVTAFQTSGGDFKDNFGAPLVPGPLTVRVEPSADTPGLPSVSALFAALPGAEEVEVKGIHNGVPGEVRAFWIRVKD